MARDRSIKLIIQAQVDGAKRALRDTAEAARKVGDETEKASKRSDTAAGRLVQSARDNSQAWGTVGTSIAGVGAALTAGFGVAVGAAAGFEKEMSGVRAVTNASASEMEALTESALEMGAQTAFSASEAAIAQGELARAGVSTADILGGALKGSMDLAAAGGLDLADAAIISAQAMNLFNLEGRDVGHIADVLASGANKSAADVSDLGQALGQAGTVASQTGLSLEETVGALSMFADEGIRGSDAGTSLKSMLQRLTPQSKEAQRVMEDLGFSAFDAQGNFIGLEALAGELQDSFGGLDTESRQAALGVAFGSDAIRAASVLMEGGAQSAAEYTDAMNDQGAAAEMAATMMDNLAGDWEEFTGSLETALIKGGTASNDFLRGLVTTATEAVNVYNGLPGAVQTGVTAMSGVVGTAALALGGIMVAVPKVVELRDSMVELADISPRAEKAVRGFGRAAGYAAGAAAVGALIIGMSELGDRMLDSQRSAEDLENALVRLGNGGWGGADLDDLFGDVSSIEDFNAELDRLADPNAWQRISRGITDTGNNLLGFVTAGADGRTESARFREELERLGPVLASMDAEAAAEGFVSLTERMNLTRDGAADLLTIMPDYRESLVATATELGVAATDANLLAIAFGEIGPEAEAAAEGAGAMTGELAAAEAEAEAAAGALDGLRSSIETLGSVMLGARGGARDFEAAIDAAAEAAKEHGANLDISTEAGRANQAALDALAGSTVNYATAAFDAGAGSQEVAAIMAAGREEFIRSAEAMGMGAEEAGILADRLGLIPENVQLMFEASGIPGIVQEIDGTVDYAASVAAMIQLGADPVQAIEAVDTYIEQANDKTATPTVDADTSPATAKTQEWVWDAASQRPVPAVDADTAAANAKTDAWRAYTQSQRPQPYIDANSSPARSVAEGWVGFVRSLFPSAKVGADDWSARGTVGGLVGWINGLRANITVGTRYAGGLNMGGADPTRYSARAAGGVERRPMLAGPQYGRTNLVLWGEPETRGEAFISNHPNYRRENIEYLRTAASWFGLDIVKAYAAGGVARQVYSAPMHAAPVDTGQIAAAVSGAMSSWQPMVSIDGRQFHGVMLKAAAGARRAGG